MNTKHNLYTESLSAKINRLTQTIQELKNIIKQREDLNRTLTNEVIELNELNSTLIKGKEIDKRVIKDRTDIIINLTDQVNYWQDYNKLNK